MINDWVESEKECVVDGCLFAKAKFTIYTNFSVFRHNLHVLLSEKNSSVAHNEVPSEPMVFDSLNLDISENYTITKITLIESRHEDGYYDVEVIFRASEQNIADKHEFSSFLSDGSELIRDFFKNTATYLGFSLLSQGYLWTHVLCGDKWKLASQMGICAPYVFPVSKEQLSQSTASLEEIVSSVKLCMSRKKMTQLLDILNCAHRLLRNNLRMESFLNFYKVIEMVFADDRFRKKVFSTLGKPSEYIDVSSRCSQKFQMLFLWEYYSHNASENLQFTVADFLDLAEIRNKLAHSGNVDISPESMSFVCRLSQLLMHELCSIEKGNCSPP